MTDLNELLRALFASDFAKDVRSEFFEHVGHGLSASSATAYVLDRFNALLSDPNDGPVLIVCVAALQLEQRQLSSTFRDAAIDLIDSGEAERAWQSVETNAVATHDRRSLLDALVDALRQSETISDDDSQEG